jgi:hypothetical protein
MKTRSSTLVWSVAVLLAAANTVPAAPAGETAVKVVDAAVVRPLGLASTVVGSALFVLSLPVTALTKTVKPTAHALIVKPAQATFKRPLGDLDAMAD